ncbi:serine/threonine-protein kinase [Actinomadura roseirufa]|uniref:serine/threonine-protein kinase n=1 Tax=Actinomadura roseirufa TaxID=2094049 RepID=UPI001A9545C6|nr:serine/threonine-protein kinase [Actinomadura roseirufa]
MNAEELPARARASRPGDPRWIGAYEVLGFLGEGGMGSVFLGADRTGRLVAIKVVRPELARDPQFRARFRREAASARRVPRFCTAEVLDHDPDAEAPYLVTEYVDAPTLRETVARSGPLSGGELDQLAVSMAAALVGIHGAGIAHRDLKPANVLLSRMGPRVIDFGVAKPFDATRITADDQVVGTPAYMAPEQVRGRPGPASDVFAWGGVMVFAATGRRPFPGESVPETAAAILRGEPNLDGLTGRLRRAVAAALTKDPKKRPGPSALLEMLGVAPAEMLAAAAPPVPDAAPAPADRGVDGRTRMDLTTGSFTQPTPTPTPMPAPPPAAGPKETRSDETSVSEWQPVYTAPGPKRGRRLARAVALLAVVAVCGVLVALYLRGQGSLKVTGVSVHTAKSRYGCDADIDLTGTVTTDGSPGEIDYQWKRSDQRSPGQRLRQTVQKGTKETDVHLLWHVSGPGKRKFSATLLVLNGAGTQKTTTFSYSCRG